VFTLAFSIFMKIVLQKVKNASVSINDSVIGKISHGLLLFVGIAHADTEKDTDWLVEKIIKLLHTANSNFSPMATAGKPEILT